VYPGQKLVVPRAPSPALLARRGDAPAAADTAPAPVAAARADVAPTRIVYRVRKGDTLYTIARKHGVTVDELRAWNNLRGSALGIGTRLSIHTTRAAAAQ
jgi:LysM repeat protein